MSTQAPCQAERFQATYVCLVQSFILPTDWRRPLTVERASHYWCSVADPPDTVSYSGRKNIVLVYGEKCMWKNEKRTSHKAGYLE